MDRPLRSEQLAVDLLNTRWVQQDQECDLLASLDGVRAWLRERRLQVDSVDERTRQALLYTRRAIDDAVNARPGAEERLNAVLARGLIVRALEHGQVRERVLVGDEAWSPAWSAAADYLQLRGAGPDAVRRCAGPTCVLFFYDPSGRRRWCSMAACGNRAKARRHYARQRDLDDRPASA